MRIPLIRPYITDEVKAEVLRVLDSGHLTEGPVTRELEGAFRQYIGCRHAVATTSCTTGLELALRCIGIGPGDEVVVPDFTYPATAAAVAIVGATAVIVDCSADTYLIDYDALEAALTPRTKAVVPVSLFGNPLDYGRLGTIRARHGVAIVEDAACAMGAEYAAARVGRLADITVFSLHPRKFITTGEGGIITTDREDWAAWIESYKHFGMRTAAAREGAVFERIGTNCKLSDLQAAVGVVQMRHVDTLLARRRELAARYAARLSAYPAVTIPTTTVSGTHSYQSFCISVPERDRILSALRENGIEAQIGTFALHRHPAFQHNAQIRISGPLAGSAAACDSCLVLPMFHDMTTDEQDDVVNGVCTLLSAPVS